jgi:excisionase family DNA binding protein
LTGAAEAGPRSDAAPLFITVEEAAQLVNVDAKTVGRWSREDATFPVLRRGRVVRVHRERYLAWLERQMPRRAARRVQESADAA